MLSLGSYWLWILCVPAAQFLFISLFFLTCLPLLHQKSCYFLYDSFHVFCFHYNIYVSAPLQPSIMGMYHLCIHIQYCHKDHLDSVALSDGDTLPEIVTPTLHHFHQG